MPEEAKQQTGLIQKRYEWRHHFLRYTGIAGKDALQAMRMVVAMGIVLWVILILECLYQAAFYQYRVPYNFSENLIGFLFLTTCYVIGITLSGEDEDNQTYIFLMRLPINPVSTLIKKCLVGITSAFLWIVLFCLLPYLLWLSGRFPESINLIEAFRSSDEIFLKGITLFLTGITMGIYSRGNLVLASIVGFVSYGVFTTGGAAIYTHLKSDQSLTFTAALINLNKLGVPFFHYLWMTIMIGFGLYRTLSREETDKPLEWKYLKKLSSKKKKVQTQITPQLLFKQHTRVLYLLAPPFALILSGLLSMLAQGDVHFFDLIALGLICSFNGVYLWSKEERDRRTFFIYSLPLEEKSFINERLWLAAKLGIYCALAVFIGKFSSLHFSGHINKEGFAYWLVFLVASIPLAIAITSLGLLVRLFCKQILIALFFVLVLAFTWTCSIAILGSSLFFKSTFSGTLETLETFIWIPLVIAVIPITLLHLLIRKSMLLELNEGARTAAVIVLTLNLGIWIPFLILISPLDIIRSLFI